MCICVFMRISVLYCYKTPAGILYHFYNMHKLNDIAQPYTHAHWKCTWSFKMRRENVSHTDVSYFTPFSNQSIISATVAAAALALVHFIIGVRRTIEVEKRRKCEKRCINIHRHRGVHNLYVELASS